MAVARLRKRLWVPSVELLVVFVTGVIVLQTELPVIVDPLILQIEHLPRVSAARARQLPTLCFLFLVVYLFLEESYPDWMGQPIDKYPGVRLATAILGFGVAQAVYLDIYRVQPGEPGPIVDVTQPPTYFVVAGLGIGLIVLSYHRLQSKPLVSPDGAAMESLLRLSRDDDPKSVWRDEMQELRRKNDGLYRILVGLTVVAIGCLNVLPVIFLGFFVGVLSHFYPILELLAVGRVMVAYLPFRTARLSTSMFPDVESEVYSQIDLLRSVPALGVFIPVFSGIMFTMVLHVSASASIDLFGWRLFATMVARAVESPSLSAIGTAVEWGIRAASGTAYGVTPVIITVYGLWFWMRTIQRLPALLRMYLDERRVHPTALDDADLPLRPRGYLLPVLLLSVLYAHHSQRFVSSRYLGFELEGLSFLLPWFAVIALIGVTVSRSRGRDLERRTASVQREVFLPFLVTFVAGFFLFGAAVESIVFGVGQYVVCNFLFYQPASGSDRNTEWWFLLAVFVAPLLGLIGDFSLSATVGLTLVMLVLWLLVRRTRQTLE